MDELPMLWGNGCFNYVCFTMTNKPGSGGRPKIAWTIAGVTLLGTLITLVDSNSQNGFLLFYSAGVAMLIYKSLGFAKLHRQFSSLLLVSLGTYFFGFYVWIVDRIMCPSVQFLHLHSVWHICAGSGTYLAVVAWFLVRMSVHKVHVETGACFPLQTVIVSAAPNLLPAKTQ